MGTAKLKLMVLSGLALATFGSAGLGMFAAPTDDGQGAKSPAKEAKAEPQKKPAEPPKKPAENAPPLLADEAAVRTVLSQQVGNLEEAMSLRELCDYLHAVYGLNARLDTLAFKRLGIEGEEDSPLAVLQYYDVKIKLPITRGLTVADLLNEAAAQLPGHVGVRFRGNQVLLGPAYKPPYTPGARSNDMNDAPFVSPKTLMEQIVGEPVSIAVDEKPFAEVLKDLRKLTGANIVVDSRCKDKTKLAVSGTFSDVRLLTVMTILADMCEMKPVWNNNVYYVTTPENAARIQKDVNKELFGEPTLAVPAGYVTDGLHLYTKPADLKLADFGLGGLGGGGGLSFRAVPAPAPEKK